MATILVVDDEQGIRSLLRRMLEQEGHQVVDTGNGGEALDLYRQAPTDLVILDMLMPGKNGMEVAWQLTREFSCVKIIAMTGGRGDANLLDIATVIGVRRTMEKPFELEDMLQAVREELQRT